MKLLSIKSSILQPAYSLLPSKMQSVAADYMLLTIGQQESGFLFNRQIHGPARGYWQFERGGVGGVLKHSASKAYAKAVCEARGVQPTMDAVYEALENDDVLAAAFARLLLWTDIQALPAVGDVNSSWNTYVRTWRPGKPKRKTWPIFYANTQEALV